MIVNTEAVDGKQIEVHEESFGQRCYWVKVDGIALFQHGRMRVRTFTTIEAAREAALKELS
jgi:hypothetical protein